jgi:hypothetical protein
MFLHASKVENEYKIKPEMSQVAVGTLYSQTTNIVRPMQHLV